MTDDVYDDGILRAFDEAIHTGDRVEFAYRSVQGHDVTREGTVEDVSLSPIADSDVVWDIQVDVDGTTYAIADHGVVETIYDYNLTDADTVARTRGKITAFTHYRAEADGGHPSPTHECGVCGARYYGRHAAGVCEGLHRLD